MTTMAEIARDTKERAVEVMRDKAQMHLEICARAFFAGDYEIARKAATNFQTLIDTLAENQA